MSHTYDQIEQRRSNVIAMIVIAMACLLLLPNTTSAQWATNGTNINSTNTGNVGIGTTTPAAKLDISDSNGAGVKINPSVWGPHMKFTSANPPDTAYGTTYFSFGYAYTSGITTNTFHNGGGYKVPDVAAASSWRILFPNCPSGTCSYPSDNFVIGRAAPTTTTPVFTDFFTVNAWGNTGFGSTTPAFIGSNIKSVDIRGSAGGGLLFGVGGGGATKLYKHSDGHTYTDYAGGDYIFSQGATEKLRLTSTGALKLSYSGVDANSAPAFMTGGYAYGGLVLSVNSYYSPGLGTYTVPLSSVQSNWSIHMNSSNPNATGPIGDMFAIKRAPATAGTPAHVDYFNIAYNGHVGIGTSSPADKLSVVGNITATGNIAASGSVTAKYQDVAEWVPARHPISAGTVVVLDKAKSNQVMASFKAYDTKAAGVVSAQPGLILGEGGEDKVMVATTGRVKVKALARNGPIEVGDLLVTSDIEGMAMKSEPTIINGKEFHAPGTIVGKALETLSEGTGVILVLLSLQ